MAVSEATSVALGVAQGLVAAHERGIIHRDLKPENTFLKSDSGMGSSIWTREAQAAGRESDGKCGRHGDEHDRRDPAYMAPEQARGESPDPRSDLFALGVMMYEMLAGQHPFRGAGASRRSTPS